MKQMKEYLFWRFKTKPEKVKRVVRQTSDHLEKRSYTGRKNHGKR